MHNRTAALLAALTILAPTVHAGTTQTLKATIDGSVFESDDDGITLVPVARSFTIAAITKGFSNYPSPPGLSDGLTIACRSFDAKPRKYASGDFAMGVCTATFTKGRSKQAFGKPVAEYEVSRKTPAPKTFVEITKVSGKVIEGRFFLEMTQEGGSKRMMADGTFTAEDRQKERFIRRLHRCARRSAAPP
ncbi:MAG: hypothetical protein ABL931_24265 [Usitatibacteraceae bacterium]